jgi:ubiquinone/menaquinone biosynthesis C-methylase UbiE/DNA-binding transcriptional ArsR family regulator
MSSKPDPAHLAFPALNAALKAAAEATRLRILALLGEAELTVSDLTEILRQSQPRISRHLRLLAEAGLVERFREGSWAFFRLGDPGGGAGGAGGVGDLARALIARLDPADPTLARDRERLAAVRSARMAAAQAYFRRHAARWDEIRKLHVADAAVEAAIRTALAEQPFRTLLDLGTGTGRMMELFGADIERGLGLDLSREMLALARTRLERAELRHCSVRQSDIYDLAVPAGAFDVVVIHQVLHYLDDGARAIREAARVLRPGGRLLVVDFAPHDLEFLRDQHAHRRLGFAAETVAQWMSAAGLEMVSHQSLPPEAGSQGKIAVSLWLARDRRVAMAAPSPPAPPAPPAPQTSAEREVA